LKWVAKSGPLERAEVLTDYLERLTPRRERHALNCVATFGSSPDRAGDWSG